jgi:hypothetical protein
MTSSAAIETQALNKAFGPVDAVKDLDLVNLLALAVGALVLRATTLRRQFI